MVSRRTRIRALALILPTAFGLGASVGDPAAAQAGSAIAAQLSAGTIGNLRIGMTQREVEALLHRRLEMDTKVDFPTAPILQARDLTSLGIATIAGVTAYGADLQFDNPLDGARRLREIAIGVSCDDMLALRERLLTDVPATEKTPYAWWLSSDSGCRLWLRVPSDTLD